MAFRSAAEILSLAPRTRWQFEGYLIHESDEQKPLKCRTSNSPVKNSQGRDAGSVAVNMHLGHDTGPIYTTLWNDAAIAFIEQCDSMTQAKDGRSLERVIINLNLAQITVVPKNN